MAELWSDAADFVVSSLERQIRSKYNLSLKALLTDPVQYASQDGIQVTVSNIREEVDKFLSERMDTLKDDMRMLDDQASRANSITSQLNQSLQSLVRQNKLPLIRPLGVERDTDNDTTIYVGTAGTETTQLMEKLVGVSDFVIDISTTYKTYTLGRWLFSGHSAIVLVVNFPSSPALTMYNTQNELDVILSTAADLIKGTVGK